MKQKDDELASQVEQLQQKIAELEQLMKEPRVRGVLNVSHSKGTDHKTEDAQPSSGRR